MLPKKLTDYDSGSESCGTSDEDAEPVRRARHKTTGKHASQWMDRVFLKSLPSAERVDALDLYARVHAISEDTVRRSV
jgi:hypothetical protein